MSVILFNIVNARNQKLVKEPGVRKHRRAKP